jgi:cation diffusion facilitator CzcD-associated flavoprotein CzcO
MTDTPAVPHNDFAIIGTGFGGSATPIPLRQAGVSDVVLQTGAWLHVTERAVSPG